jgi:single-strand DNA-binding protein
MASKSVNKVILLGRLGKDAETKFTPAGISKTSFSLATSRSWKDKESGEFKETTDWHNVVIWRAENLANYLLKGKQVYLEGRLESRSYEDQQGQKRYITEVVAFPADLILLGGGDRGGDAPSGGGEYDQQRPVSMPRSAQRQAPAPSAPAHDDFGQGVTDDDVPF